MALLDGIKLRDASVAELLHLYGEILRELSERKITRTTNAPAGDYAEYLVHQALGGKIAPNSEKSWDIETPEGKRVQVKCRVVLNRRNRGQRQLSVIRSFDFDDLALVLFDPSYAVVDSVLVPSEIVRDSSSYRAYVNGYVLFATDTLLHHPRAVDISDRLRAVR